MTSPEGQQEHLMQPIGVAAELPDGRTWEDVVRNNPGWVADMFGVSTEEDV